MNTICNFWNNNSQPWEFVKLVPEIYVIKGHNSINFNLHFLTNKEGNQNFFL